MQNNKDIAGDQVILQLEKYAIKGPRITKKNRIHQNFTWNAKYRATLFSIEITGIFTSKCFKSPKLKEVEHK